ncbi:DUF308 domain-containing protein [Herbiconiux sp. SYSU D00978]|uniref:DUF308 domain-containing protein n=1 Tax=Herbiconiux sp. SYSU D00978 TaxID=2812562 RepID=UPI001A969CAA|nr:DUF308 domain-containing protein [Herbiconiux sp. SYSU D00978]
MPISLPTASARSAYWRVLAVRAAAALALALVITFSQDHSARLGLVTFGVFAVASGALTLWLTLRSGLRRSTATLLLVQAVVGIVSGALALLFADAGTGVFLAIVTAYALIAGALELVAGLRERRTSALSREWIGAGALTVLLAVALLLLPPDLAQDFSGPDGVARQLTAAIVGVGLLGAWAAIVGVYSAIGALSVRGARKHPVERAGGAS